MAGNLNSRKVSCNWIVVSLLSLLSINIKYLYLTPNSSSQITILLDESNVEEITGWLTVNNGEIVRVDKPRKKNSTSGKFFFSRNHIYNRIINSEIALDLLRNLYNGGQGHRNLHRLLTSLHSARLPNLHPLFTECEQLIVANQEQRFRRIVLDVCCKRLFFPVRTDTNSTAKPRRRFIKVFFHNKGIDNVQLKHRFYITN